MSAVRDAFHASILAKRYGDAALQLNGLSMAEMLPALACIGDGDPEFHRRKLMAALINAADKIDVRRMTYAISVVSQLVVPGEAPGDLVKTGQVADAVAFVAIPSVTPATFKDSPDKAAMYVIRAINPTSILQNREFWGLIFKRGDAFTFSNPTRAEETGATPVFLYPPGTTGIGAYHTHGAGYARINGSTAAEIFSLEDRLVLKNNKADGYVGTPDHQILKLTKPPTGPGTEWELGKVSKLE